MKKQPNFTNEEKQEILQNYEKFKNDLNNSTEGKFILHGIFGVVLPVMAILVALIINPLAVRVLLVSLFACTFIETLFYLDKVRSFKKIVTKKMSYKQFKQLEKSGELKKWEQELNNKKFEATEYISNETDKIKLSVSPATVYKHTQKRQEVKILSDEKIK